MAVRRFLPRDHADWSAALAATLPRGAAWSRDPAGLLMRIVGAVAWVFADCQRLIYGVVATEANPRRTIDLLPEWEEVCGLPDPCSPATATRLERRNAVVAKLSSRGGQSIQYFADLARSLGYAVEITDYSPLQCGISSCGHQMDRPAHLGDPLIRYVWTVTVAEARTSWFRCGHGLSECGIHHHVQITRAEDLECQLRRLKPAHSRLIFDYTGA